MPILRPFRALRYDPLVVGDVGAVICPPYDVISAAERVRLLARHPRNAVRIELPDPLALGPGDRRGGAADPRGDPDAPYRTAGRTLRSWRRDGTLRLDERPSLYAYEQHYRLPGDASASGERSQRGFFARLLLEPLGNGIRAHERTLSAPKADRLRLLRETATDTSPIVVLSDDPTGRTLTALARTAGQPPTAEATDASGIRHRLWAIPPRTDVARQLVAGAEGRPLTIADGHHRYETAVRYRDERAAGAQGDAADHGREGGGRPVDFVLALVLDAGETGRASGPTVLPTHRLVATDDAMARRLATGLARYFSMTERPPEELVRDFSPPFEEGPTGRFGLLAAGRAFLLDARDEAIAPLFGGDVPAVVRSIDTAIVDAVLGRLLTGDGARDGGATSAAGAELPQVSYTHDAREALDAVESGASEAAVLLRPTSVAEVIRVAAAGALMPQKSTYFYPKAATGLVMYPLE